MGRRPGPSLDRASVVAAAAALADKQGLEAVTLSSLAAQLGVRTPSLYNHVAGQDGLRRELALVGLHDLARMLGRAAVGRARDDALRQICRVYREFAHQHPGLYAALQGAPEPGDTAWTEAATEVVGLILEALHGYGLPDAELIHLTRGLRSALHGFVMLENQGGFGLPLGLDESFERLIELIATGLRTTAERAAATGA